MNFARAMKILENRPGAAVRNKSWPQGVWLYNDHGKVVMKSEKNVEVEDLMLPQIFVLNDDWSTFGQDVKWRMNIRAKKDEVDNATMKMMVSIREKVGPCSAQHLLNVLNDLHFTVNDLEKLTTKTRKDITNYLLSYLFDLESWDAVKPYMEKMKKALIDFVEESLY